MAVLAVAAETEPAVLLDQVMAVRAAMAEAPMAAGCMCQREM